MLLSFALPAETNAQLLTCNAGDECNFCELTRTLDNIIDWTVAVAVLIAVIGLMYSGFRMTSSRGDVSTFSAAKEMFGNVVIGLFIIMAAWMIVDTIIKTLAGGDLGVWNDVDSCTGTPGMFDVGDPAAIERLEPEVVEDNIIEVATEDGSVYDEEGPGSVIGGGGGEITPYVDGDDGPVSFAYSASLAVAQQNHSSARLVSFQGCIANRLPGGTYIITSVSDNMIANGSRTWEQCRSGQCQHTANSCHYGGRSCTDGSYALDIRTSNLSSSQRTRFLQAANACGGYGQDEGNHLHVSIGAAAGCGCN